MMIPSRLRPAPHFSLTAVPAILLAGLATLAERARQRRQLAGLSDWQLRDIGLSRADVDGETSKPFWRV